MQEANGIDLGVANPSPCDLLIAVDTVPAEVLSAAQYLAGSPWTPYSKVSSRLSNGVFNSEFETSFNCDVENLDVDSVDNLDVKSARVPYDHRTLRLPDKPSIDILDGASESFPSILEAASILDSSVPTALRGKAGRQGMISLQKTLAILASRQLALPLGKFKSRLTSYLKLHLFVSRCS